ncbi:MAG: DUF2065 domain-containing protein [Desulfobacterales bacterium]|nr:DUF2065 domain-containing protein [Desulfobacterales bacterium]
MKYFFCVIGMVLIIEGLPYLAFPNKMKEWLLQILEMEDSQLRTIGFVMIFIGLILINFIGK